MHFSYILACLFLFCRAIKGNPTGCTYDATNVLYTCDGRGWVLPLSFAAFTNQPQRLLLKDVSGELAASAPNGPTFTGFSSMNTALFDPRFSPSFHVKCFTNGHLMIFKDTFQDFGWVEEVKIQDCDILSLPTQVFLHFGEVNSFIIQGGSVDNMVADSFNGLDVKKMTTAISPKGEFIIRNCQIIGGALAFGALFTMANATTIMIDGAHLSSLSTDTFYANPKVTNLSISYNNFSDIPSGLFTSSHSLQYVAMWGIPWQCTCNYLWFVPYVTDNNITLDGDIACTGKRAVSYYYANCLSYDLCEDKIGFVIGDKCFTAIDSVIYIFTVLSTVTIIIAFGLVLQLQCRLKKAKAIAQDQKNKEAIKKASKPRKKTKKTYKEVKIARITAEVKGIKETAQEIKDKKQVFMMKRMFGLLENTPWAVKSNKKPPT